MHSFGICRVMGGGLQVQRAADVSTNAQLVLLNETWVGDCKISYEKL